MQHRPIRTLVAALATLGLTAAIAAIPTAAMGCGVATSTTGDASAADAALTATARLECDAQGVAEADGDEAGANLEAGTDVDEGVAAAIAIERRQDGKPDWLPGPPPWVFALLESLHPDGLPAGFGEHASATAEAAVAGELEASGADAARVPSHVTLPAQAAAGSVEGEASAGIGSDAAADVGITIEITAGASGNVIVPPLGGRP